MTKELFEEEFAKLDFNADKLVSLSDLKKHGMLKREQQENLAIGIVWIGHTLNPCYLPHRTILDKLITYEENHENTGRTDESRHSDESSFYPWFELNQLGEPICLNEYTCRIATGSNTHVI